MIHARVQHHPERKDLLPRLLHHLTPLPVEVVEHHSQPANPWAGFRLCLTDLPECDHVLTIQDDAIPVPGFVDAIQEIAATTNAPVCLWLSNLPASAASRARKAFGKQNLIPLGPAPFVPLVAVLWPRQAAVDFLEWADSVPRVMTRADDGNVARWVRATRQEFMVTVPSLVEHDDFTPSVKGGGPQASGGRNRTRVALLLADDARDYWP